MCGCQRPGDVIVESIRGHWLRALAAWENPVITANSERRHFSRIVVERSAKLIGPAGAMSVSVEDLSLNGALLRLEGATSIDQGSGYRLEFPLSGDVVINLDLKPAHQHGSLAGFACRYVDLESAAHLRRLIELNLGDPALLHRELGELATGAAR